jgi:hypothetical protein
VLVLLVPDIPQARPQEVHDLRGIKAQQNLPYRQPTFKLIANMPAALPDAPHHDIEVILLALIVDLGDAIAVS